MRRLPPFHIRRPRLTQACADQSVVVIEAAAGYGKSVLGAELVNAWWTVGVEVQLQHRGMPAKLLAARLRSAVAAAGFTDAAAAAQGGDAWETVEGLTRALAKERCAFVIDDAHLALAEAGRLIEHLAESLDGDEHLVVLARQLPEGAQRLRRADYFHLTAKDLAFTADETLELCRTGFGLATGPDAARTITRATGGWTAATVLAAARVARTGEAAEDVAAVAGTTAVPETAVPAHHAAGPAPAGPAPAGLLPDAGTAGPAGTLAAAGVAGMAAHGAHTSGAVAALMDEAIVALGPAARPRLAQVARLPLLDQRAVAAATGDHTFFDKAAKAGLPFIPLRGYWWDLPGPVRDFLATFAPRSADAMRKAGRDYAERGELGAALQLLIASGDPGEAAALLARTPPEDTESMDVLELQAVFDQLPAEVVDAHPNVLVAVARGHGVAFQYRQRAVLLQRAADIASRTGNSALARFVQAEHANDLCREFRYDDAESLARQVMVEAADEERLAKARACYALGRALCLNEKRWGYGDDSTVLAEASDAFRRSVELYLALGMRSAAAPVLMDSAYLVDLPQGRATAALAQLNQALTYVVDRPRRWAWVMTARARVAAELGLEDICQASLEEIFLVAEQFHDDLLWAYGHYRAALLTSYRGQAEATLDHLRQVELHRSENWWDQASASFLGEAADLADRVGRADLAREYLARAHESPKNAGHIIALSEAVVEARHGDPARAEELLSALAPASLGKRELWRVTLLRGYAALRNGDHHAAGALAARSFEEAARLGQPQLPMVRERAITEQLLRLAVETGQPAAAALEASTLPLSLALLGRFALAEAGRPVPLSAGQETKLLKYVAVSGGRVHLEQAIETLWPEVGRDAGRNRMRTVLNRLRGMAGPVMVRTGDVLTLHDTVRVDLRDFLAEAHRAQSLAATDLVLATAIARGAMARYQGQLLPDDLYEDWTELPRENAKKVMLELLDLCATEAAGRGDLDELRRVIERSIEFDPYDDSRYLRAASTLVKQGRRGEALSVLKRARSALSELGLEPPRHLVELERSIVA